MRLEWIAWILTLCVACGQRAAAQTPAPHLLSGDFQHFDVDNLGNLYVLTRGHQLRKYSPRGDSVGVFNDVVKYGRLRAMDVSNPMRILLFYPDFGTILLLDRMLKPLDAIDLRRTSMLQVSAVATSYDNQCWVYDEQEARLRKIDAQGRVLLESPDLRMIMDEPPAPVYMSDQQGTVSLYDPVRGLYRFDQYGAFRQRIPVADWSDVRVSGALFEGVREGGMIRYDLKTGRTGQYAIPPEIRGVRQLVFQTGIVYILNSEGFLRIVHPAETTH